MKRQPGYFERRRVELLAQWYATTLLLHDLRTKSYVGRHLRGNMHTLTHAHIVNANELGTRSGEVHCSVPFLCMNCYITSLTYFSNSKDWNNPADDKQIKPRVKCKKRTWIEQVQDFNSIRNRCREVPGGIEILGDPQEPHLVWSRERTSPIGGCKSQVFQCVGYT